VDLATFKSNIDKIADEESWTLTQIQYAENFIDDLFEKGPDVMPRTEDGSYQLNPKHVATIRALFVAR